MLTPDYLEHCADEAVKINAELENFIIKDIARRIVQAGTMTETARHQIKVIQESGYLYDDVIEEIANIINLSSKEVKKIFENAAVETINYDDKIYELAGVKPTAFRKSPVMMQILKTGINKANGNINNLIMTTAGISQSKFQEITNMAYRQYTSGAFDYNTAIFNAVEQLSKEGINVLYPSGKLDKIDVAVRRAVLTGVNQTANELQDYRAEEMNCDLVEVTAHIGARVTEKQDWSNHAWWQGKVYSISGKNNKYPPLSVTGYKIKVDGLAGINCRHNKFPFIEGISKRAYTDKELEEINNKTVIYNGEEIGEYEALKTQRKKEREIREIKRQLSGYQGIIVGSNDEKLLEQTRNKFAITSNKLKVKEKDLQDFINQTGLKRNNERERVIGFNKSLSKKVVNESRKSTKLDNNGIINQNLTLTECKDIIEKHNIKFCEKDLSNIDEKLLSDNVNRIDYLIEKYPKMKRFIRSKNVKFNALNLGDSTIAHVATDIDINNIEITLSKRKYKNYNDFIKMEDKELKIKHCMQRSNKYKSVYSITHEFGHFIESSFIDEYNKKHLAEFLNMKNRVLNAKTLTQSKNILKKWQENIADEISQEIYNIALKNNQNIKVNDLLSTYGRENSFEFFAECFANLECGRPNELGKALGEYLKRRGL